MFDNPTALMIRIPVILLALTVHEFCHAYFALRMGDPTAYRMGRCTLNPIKHLDLLGTICLMFAPIGWAKPVPINPMNFHDRRKGILVSTAAGPLSNLAQAIFWALLLRLVLEWGYRLPPGGQMQQFAGVASEMFYLAIGINTALAVFNCLPVFPLDGFHITLQLMRPEAQQRFVQTARFGPVAILALVLVGNTPGLRLLSRLIDPPADFILKYVAGLPMGG
ncbi:MAG: site-2 protease family protein [Phycisphaerae bacterium]